MVHLTWSLLPCKRASLCSDVSCIQTTAVGDVDLKAGTRSPEGRNERRNRFRLICKYDANVEFLAFRFRL